MNLTWYPANIALSKIQNHYKKAESRINMNIIQGPPQNQQAYSGNSHPYFTWLELQFLDITGIW